MSDVAETLIDGLLEREAAERSSLAWAGGEYPCSGGEEIGGKKLEIAGFKLHADVTIVLRTAVFPDQNTRPQEQQFVTYTSRPGAIAKQLCVDSATLLYDAILVLGCNDPNRAA